MKTPKTPAGKAMQDAAAESLKQHDVMEAYILLYGTASPQLAEESRERAHQALDAILDAQRAKHINLVRALRGE